MTLSTLTDQVDLGFPATALSIAALSCSCVTVSGMRVRRGSLPAPGFGKPGDRVTIVSENCAQQVELMFGVWAMAAERGLSTAARPAAPARRGSIFDLAAPAPTSADWCDQNIPWIAAAPRVFDLTDSCIEKG
jgi:hypothetical protein